MKLDPEKEATRLKFTAMELLRQETVYYTGHCTGEEQYAALKTHMGERLHRLSTGAVFEI
jgi:7,8-dihydropterin-6-yl-methyl-4-(beta-D-ribofuranosyl)aminobenzene 5'-phosphate synthase